MPIHRSFLGLSFILLILNNSQSFNFSIKNSDSEKKYVISGWSAGFFSNFLGVLNHILYAQRNNLVPVVFWGPKFLYYEPIAPNGNAWDYYFEPISHLSYQPGDTFDNEVHAQSTWIPAHWNNMIPSYWVASGYQIPHNRPIIFNQDLRDLCHGLIIKYIRIKPHIANKVDAFYQTNMQGKITIGIHLRGTDKPTEVGLINHEDMLSKANEIAEQLGPNTQFFVATDEERLLNLAKDRLNRNVICSKTIKAESVNGQSLSQALWAANNGYEGLAINKLIVGEEVLIDALLLARCDAFIPCLSLVSQCAAYFNPYMPCYLVTHQVKKDSINCLSYLINNYPLRLFYS